MEHSTPKMVIVVEVATRQKDGYTVNTTLLDSAGLYDHALKIWEGLSQELNYNVMFSQRGVMNLAHNLQDVRDLKEEHTQID